MGSGPAQFVVLPQTGAIMSSPVAHSCCRNFTAGFGLVQKPVTHKNFLFNRVYQSYWKGLQQHKCIVPSASMPGVIYVSAILADH